MLVAPAEATDRFLARTRGLAISFLFFAPLSIAPAASFAQTGVTVPLAPPPPLNATYAQPEAARGPRRASVTYTGGLLTVAASNSSLNQILREIAHQTGLKITGGVTDDRVFGTYGPATPATVLATLLDGTSSNLLIVQGGSETPMQLILTPRVGGVTPPNPNASGFDDSDSAPENISLPVRSPAPLPPAVQGNSRAPNRAGTGGIDVNPAATAPSSTSQQLAFPPIDQSTPSSTATTTPVSPDASGDTVKTPQQIFEQLQKLRQQQAPTTPPQ